MSYLGKISAIVSANTSDFSAKLAASGKEVQSWARSLNSAVNSASAKASSSLRGIYTEAQKAERALQAIQARKISFKGFEGQDLASAVGRMQSLISATKGVYEPLSKIARTVEKLPVDMQGGFSQALQRAQVQAERLASAIDRVGGGLVSDGSLERRFAAAAARIRETAEAAERLKEASAAVSGLAGGGELRFRRPDFLQEINRAKAAQAAAAGTGEAGFSDTVARQRVAADAVAAAFTRIENAQLSINGDVRGATAEYERQLGVLRSITAELEQAVALSNARKASESKAVESANQFMLNEADRRDGTLARRNSASFDAATEGVLTTPTRSEASAAASEAERKARLLRQSDEVAKRTMALSPDLQSDMADEVRALQNIASAAREGSASVGVLADKLDRVEASLSSAEQAEALRRAAQEFSMSSDELAKTAKEKGGFQPLEVLEKSAAEQRRMQDEMRRIRAQENFGTTVGRTFESSSIGKAKAEIAALQAILIKVGATTGDAADAVDDLAMSWQRATSEAGGTVKYAQLLKDSLDGAVEEVQKVAAASGQKIDVRKVLSNAGDIGRFGADKFTLGMQQAIFAVDDFFSVTGDLQQRVRAIGNNLTQLGFIIGGTSGLFVSLAASLTLQGVAALIKWSNNGRTAEDQTKALNDSLARQKSLVEELKQAFESLGDSIARRAFSAPAKEARDFAKELEDIKKKQKEAREERAFSLDEGVLKARADVNVAQKAVDSASTRDASVEAQRQLAEARERLREQESRVRGRRDPTADDVRVATDEIFARERERRAEAAARTAGATGGGAGAVQGAREMAMREGDRLRQSVGARLAGVNDPSAAREILRDEQRQARDRGDTRLAAQLEELINSLEAPIKRATDELAVSVLEGSVKVARSLESTQQLLDATLIPFSQTRAGADKAAAELTKINDELKTAEDPARIAELQKQQSVLEQQSARYRSAAEVIRTFADTVKRVSTDLANAVEGETRSIADKARRDANRAAAAASVDGEFGPNGERRRLLGPGGDAQRDSEDAQGDRRRAEQEARRAQVEAVRVREESDRLRREFEAGIADDPQVQAERERLEELQAVIDSKDPIATEERKARAAEEKAIIRRRQERRFEDSPQGREAVALADQADQRAAAAQEAVRQADEQRRAGLRGRDLGLTEGKRASREAINGLLDIAAARERGYLDPQEAQEQARRFAQEQLRSAAPAIFDMADAVQNAVLQGPSRQALEVSDISTMEGSRELNRLMRGDDASKNANIVELEKQNQKLTELVDVMKVVADNIGIVLDL